MKGDTRSSDYGSCENTSRFSCCGKARLCMLLRCMTVSRYSGFGASCILGLQDLLIQVLHGLKFKQG